jgi:hypothetical protein
MLNILIAFKFVIIKVDNGIPTMRKMSLKRAKEYSLENVAEKWRSLIELALKIQK